MNNDIIATFPIYNLFVDFLKQNNYDNNIIKNVILIGKKSINQNKNIKSIILYDDMFTINYNHMCKNGLMAQNYYMDLML